MSDKYAGGIKGGSTSVSWPFRLLSTAGAAVTGKVASNLTAYYWRQGGSPTSISLSDLAAIDSAYSSGGVKEASSSGIPGVYRLDLPNAAVSTGADWVIVGIVCSGSMDYEERIPLESVGNSETYARVGAPAGASIAADIAALPASVWASATRTLTSVSALAAQIASAVLDAVAASYNTTGTIGAKINSAASGSGDGDISHTITIKDASNNPVDGAHVWVTTTIGGTPVASGYTNSAGQVTFMLDAGAYYQYVQAAGHNFINPSAVTVS